MEHQLLYVMSDMENDTRTHHIHIVKWTERSGKIIFISGIILMLMKTYSSTKQIIFQKVNEWLGEELVDNAKIFVGNTFM